MDRRISSQNMNNNAHGSDNHAAAAAAKYTGYIQYTRLRCDHRRKTTFVGIN